jgi:integrase
MNPNITIIKDIRNRRKPWLVRWFGDFDPKAGKRIRYCKSFARRADAERYAEQLKDDYNNGMSLESKDITLQELLDKCIAIHKNKAVSTLNAYLDTQNRLLTYFNPTISIKKIRQEDAEAYISQMDFVSKQCQGKGKTISDSTKSRHLRETKALFNKALEWGYIRKNPFEFSLGKLKTRGWHPITPEQFQAILMAVQKSRIRKSHEQEDRARIVRLIGFYNVMYYCGLRSGEASNLMSHSNQIDFEKGLIHIFNTEGTKNYPAFRVKDHEARSIPMPTCVVNALVEVQEVAEEGCPYIFLSKHSYERVKRNWHQMVSSGRSKEWQNDMMMNNALRNFKRHCRWAGIKTDKRLSIQELRKGYGTNLANLGTPMQTLKDLMGHSSIVTTMEYYVNSLDANKLKAVAGLDQLMENSTLGTKGGE